MSIKEVEVVPTECPSCLVVHRPDRMCRPSDVVEARRTRAAVKGEVLAPVARTTPKPLKAPNESNATVAPKIVRNVTEAEARLAEIKRKNAARQRAYRERERDRRKKEQGG